MQCSIASPTPEKENIRGRIKNSKGSKLRLLLSLHSSLSSSYHSYCCSPLKSHMFKYVCIFAIHMSHCVFSALLQRLCLPQFWSVITSLLGPKMHKGVLSGEADESGNANSFYYWNYSKCIVACLPRQAHGACKNVQISLKNWR